MDDRKSTYQGYTEARARANKKYIDKFVEVKVRMNPQRRDTIKAFAEANGESVNGFINRAIDEAMERDGTHGGYEGHDGVPADPHE